MVKDCCISNTSKSPYKVRRCNKLSTLQIANGYYQSDLYRALFSALEENNIENYIYVPINKKASLNLEIKENIISSKCFSNIDRILFFTKQQKMVDDIQKHIDLSNIDIIHAHTLFSGGYAAYQLYKNSGLPYIVAVRNTDVNVFFKRLIYLRKTGIEIMQNAEKVVFLSPAYQNYVLKKYVPQDLRKEIQTKSTVIPNGIDPLFFKTITRIKKDPSVPLRLIYVGEINSNKNLELSIQAIKLLHKRGMKIQFVVVGEILDDKYFHMLQRENFIEYHKKCSLENVLYYLRNSDIFVMPSHTETFGLVYAEAMSQGLPVIYTRGQGFDGHFPDGTVGYAVSDKDSRELADKIELVSNYYSRLSQNCLKSIDKFKWSSIAEKYNAIYKEILLQNT